MAARKSQTTSVLGLLDFFHPSEPLMAIFQAFFDESGKFKDKQVISFCGLCSPPARINKFEDEWKTLLRHYGLTSLTMKRALRRKIKFSHDVAAHSVEERNAVLKRFAACIREHFELGVAVTVDVKAYSDWGSNPKRLLVGSDNPHYFSFIIGLIASVQHVEVQKDNRLSFICDDDEETAINCYKLYRKAKATVPQIRRTLAAISFAEDEDFVPLQAADLVSSVYRMEAQRRFHRLYYEYMPLFNALTAQTQTSGDTIKWSEHFYDAKELKELARSRRPVTASA